MGRLRYFDITDVVFIGILICAGITKTTCRPNAVISPASNGQFIMKAYNNFCQCINYNCACCQHVTWNALSMDGELCINATFFGFGHGYELKVTYKNIGIYNETISAKNLRLICSRQEDRIVNAADAEICLHIYDIDFNKFHACFEISGMIMKLVITKVKLGCIN